MSAYQPLYYRDYLQLPTILGAQIPRSTKPQESKSQENASQNNISEHNTGVYGTQAFDTSAAHDELLFIITHQTYELWFKQILHEIDSVRMLLQQNPLPEPDVATALHRLQRVNTIAKLLVQQVDVLETMTPMDFLDFRGVLYPASGFQSLQFRLLEIKLGLSDEQRVPVHLQLDTNDTRQMEGAKAEPSLFVLVEQWLERMPFLRYTQQPDNCTMGNITADSAAQYEFWQEYKTAVSAMFAHERAMLASHIATAPMAARLLAQMEASELSFQALFNEEEYERLLQSGARRLSFNATKATLFIFLYREYPLLQVPFRLLEAILELDELITLWRYRHAQMAFRMIGSRVGTGGSSGHEYLASAAMKHRIFADYSVLSAFLIPRYSLPALPQEISNLLGFAFQQSA
jgi:tryptophan 2,3-dioxygenase